MNYIKVNNQQGEFIKMLKQSEFTELIEKLGLDKFENEITEDNGNDTYSFTLDTYLMDMGVKLLEKLVMKNGGSHKVNMVVAYKDGSFGMINSKEEGYVPKTARISFAYVKLLTEDWAADDHYVLFVEKEIGTYELVMQD